MSKHATTRKWYIWDTRPGYTHCFRIEYGWSERDLDLLIHEEIVSTGEHYDRVQQSWMEPSVHVVNTGLRKSVYSYGESSQNFVDFMAKIGEEELSNEESTSEDIRCL